MSSPNFLKFQILGSQLSICISYLPFQNGDKIFQVQQLTITFFYREGAS